VTAILAVARFPAVQSSNVQIEKLNAVSVGVGPRKYWLGGK
jgi:hypothetical protein